MREQILKILMEIEPFKNFENSKDFFKEGLLDSFGIMIFIGKLEEIFNIKVSAEDIDASNFMNLDAILHLLEKYMD